VLGLWLAHAGGWFASPWLHMKLALVLLLSGAHGFFSRCVKDFARDRNRRTQRFYRFINEVPTLLMIGIVLVVVLKPFG
jgi:putative membrane protein